MFSLEEFQKQVKAIADNIPDQFKSTIGGHMHWIVSQTFIIHIQPKLEALEARLHTLELALVTPQISIENTENANEKGWLQEPQGNEKIAIKTPRRGKE
jgi:hypothetical protein